MPAAPRRACLVTGASRGIGAATARRLARDGFDIVVHYHREAKGAEETAAAVREAGREALVLQADVADAQACAAIVAEATRAFPHLDTLVNNAGTYPRAKVEAIAPEDWARLYAVNVQGAFHVTQALVPHLRKRGAGAIVNVSSVLAVAGSGHGAHYAGTKAALLAITRSLARELAPKIRVNAVCPGAIDTDILAGDTEEKRRERERAIPLGRVGRPEEIASVIAFLVGPDSSYMTGATVHANGGAWMG